MRSLICGVGGQDGALLARFLLGKGHEVWGTSRDAELATFSNLDRLGLRGRVKTLSLNQTDFRSVFSAIRSAQPQEIYFLSGQSSVGLSFSQPAETLHSIATGVLNMLEAIRLTDPNIRFYNASSSECFGDIGGTQADETTSFRPRSPYGVAKASAHWLVQNYREAYGVHASNGILFNHESPLRPERFVTMKIVAAAKRIRGGSKERLTLGNLHIMRDWGWAPEYVEAMWLMLQSEKPDDYIIATGRSHSLEDFVSRVFDQFGLEWRDHVDFDPSLIRPTDLAFSAGNPAHAAEVLGWRSVRDLNDIIRGMVSGEC